MHEIGASKLTDLLNRGFDGEVSFEGRVFGRVDDMPPQEPNARFYEANGRFRIIGPVDGRNGYILHLGTNDDGMSSFRFEKVNGERAVHTCPEKYGDIVSVPITLRENAFLQIEPRKIFY